jgi:uncharacterized protein (TIGR00661 family)
LKEFPNILVCPLDWGIGHATRCVPVIRELLRQNVNVIIGAGGRPLAFLKQEFPTLQFIEFPGYRFSYPASGNMAFKMILQSPRILWGIRKERQLLEQIIKNYNIDCVISDNRFGLSTKKTPSVFITHQVMIKAPRCLPFMESILYRVNRYFISKFNECWIPDFDDEPNLSGDLSHLKPLPSNSFYVGPLSRFDEVPVVNSEQEINKHIKYDFLVLLSGPEPQRTILEEKILTQLEYDGNSALVLSGKPESKQEMIHENNIRILPHLDTESLKIAVSESDIILSRPGYSTIMDLAVLGKKAVFIPTPGQTEQEYLAAYCMKNKWYYSMAQDKIDLNQVLNKTEHFSGFKRKTNPSFLRARISSLIRSI